MILRSKVLEFNGSLIRAFQNLGQTQALSGRNPTTKIDIRRRDTLSHINERGKHNMTSAENSRLRNTYKNEEMKARNCLYEANKLVGQGSLDDDQKKKLENYCVDGFAAAEAQVPRHEASFSANTRAELRLRGRKFQRPRTRALFMLLDMTRLSSILIRISRCR